MKPTAQQAAFLSTLLDTPSNITLQARAGCGKTTAILMGVQAYATKFPKHSILVCAFNKSIALEVGSKIKRSGLDNWQLYSAQTVHSMGMGLINFAFRKPKLDENKVKALIQTRILKGDFDSSLFRSYMSQVIDLVGYAKQAALGYFGNVEDDANWLEITEHFDVNGFSSAAVMQKVIKLAQSIYLESIEQTSVIDFDDMILFPLVHDLKVKFTKDLIFVDEAQDLSPARQALVKMFITPKTGRLVIVGDDRQAIYGFSGADAQAMENLTAEMHAVVLPLSVTWRCAESIVREANTLVPDLEFAPSACMGDVCHIESLPSDLTPGKEIDAVLCRNTAPLIDIAYSLIRSGKPAKVEGRKIGEGLIKLATKWKINTTDQLSEKLYEYLDIEVAKFIAKGKENRIADVQDKVGTVLEIIDCVNRDGKHNISDVVDFINTIFADGAENVITLCTYHRSKGREWNRVILWEHAERCPSKWAKQSWQQVQESNLAYVAITRAKNQLVYVN